MSLDDRCPLAHHASCFATECVTACKFTKPMTDTTAEEISDTVRRILGNPTHWTDDLAVSTTTDRIVVDVTEAIAEAVAAEREACAELVESLWSPSNPLDGRYLLAAAAAIRSRGEAT